MERQWCGSCSKKVVATPAEVIPNSRLGLNLPVKHADETSWRIKGLNGWLWAFLTKTAVYYTIEHSRGKGVAEVELTNNLAERGIRKAVVVRKISGGSRSDLGAETFAINMSVIQTIRVRNQPIIPTLHNLLLKGALGNTI